MSWDFVLTDLAGKPRSELAGARMKRAALPVRSMATASVNVPLDHPDADFMLGGDALLKVYQVNDDFLVNADRVLLAHTRLVNAVESVEAGKIAAVTANFADPLWVLMRRMVGKSRQGLSFTATDRAVIISTALGLTNAESHSGVRMGNTTASSSTDAGPYYFKRVGELIAEVCSTLDGPDWRVRPIEWVEPPNLSPPPAPPPYADAGIIGELDVAPVIGTLKLDQAFEFGDGRLNVAGYSRMVDNDGRGNRFINLPPGFPDNPTQNYVQAEDPGLMRNGVGLLEDLVASDLTPDALRNALVQYHLKVRGTARQTITFTVAKDPVGDGKRIPRLGRDVLPGDVVPFRASVTMRNNTLAKRIDALFRLYQGEVTVDDVGAATVTITINPNA